MKKRLGSKHGQTPECFSAFICLRKAVSSEYIPEKGFLSINFFYGVLPASKELVSKGSFGIFNIKCAVILRYPLNVFSPIVTSRL